MRQLPDRLSPLVSAPRLCALCAALLLSACASFRGIAPTAVATDRVALPATDTIAQASDAWPAPDWWTAYGDSQLNALIEHALANNPNLAAAQARIVRAQAAAALNRAAASPQLNGAVEASYGRQSENYLLPKPPLGPGGEQISQGLAALNFSHDLDLWGRNASLIRAADAQQAAAAHDREAARLALTTSIARAYAQLASQYELQDVLLATQKQREAIRDLTAKRVAGGLDTRVELKQSETSEAALRVDLEQLTTLMEVTRLQLAALAGDMPSAASHIARPRLMPAPFTVPHDLPLDLLGRRPEVAAQSARIGAAVGEAQAAKAQFYPNISLTALAGFQSIGLGQLLTPGSFMTSIGPAIHLPLFDAGRLRANYAAKTADIDAAIAQYNQSVVAAAQDVAEQLARAAALSREEKAVSDALAAAEEAYRLAMLRYRGGLSPYLTVLAVESQLLAQRRAAVDLKAKRHELQIGLVRALGGGFGAPAMQAASAPQ
jgi:NodT family efflux transporter outer membrane factor (OMF) lipoprotein